MTSLSKRTLVNSRCAPEIVCTVAVTSHCGTINRIDVIQALGTVEVALMDAVDADETGTPLGGQRTARADRHRPGRAAPVISSPPLQHLNPTILCDP
jgi:hypothetical protein